MLFKIRRNSSFLFIALLSLLLMCILFFMHLRSTNSIRELQNGNALAGQTFQINNVLQEIVNNINTAETNFLTFLNEKNTSDSFQSGRAVEDMNKNMALLDTLTTHYPNDNDINKLASLIKAKSAFYQSVEDNLNNENVSRAILYSDENKILNDSIYLTALSIQIEAENILQKKINQNFTASSQALFSSKAFTLISISAILLLGTIIIIHLLRNNQLINALEISKKNADNAANIKEQFLANMSHEIRTPVNSIIGFTKLLQQTALVADQKNFVNYIKTSGDNLLHIVNDILDISKIEAGMLHIQKEPFSVSALCYYLEMTFYNEGKRIPFNYQINPDVPEIISGDEERLKQILTNLIGNAFKFTHNGSINLIVSIGENSAADLHIFFKVSDTGIGIAENKLTTIFERFEQANSKITNTYGGTGLGLSIVKKLADMLGGEIWVKSKLGEGSEFTLSIPLEIPKNISQLELKSINEIKEIPSAAIKIIPRKKILIAEDNRMNQLLLEYIFKQWEARYTIVQNGKEVIDILKNEAFDLVLMDIQMPVMDGYQATAYIRNELKSNIPIIAMTAFVLQGEKDKCFSFGMNDYLPKPLNDIKLRQVLVKFLQDDKLDNTAYISIPYLKEIFSGNKEYIINILNLFIVHYPKDLSLIRIAYNNKQVSEVKALAHNMKNTISSVNDRSPLMKPLQSLEELSLTDTDWELANKQLSQLTATENDAIKEAEHILTDL